ncbi:MAG: SpoIIE family protein phosphatase [Acidimicrobiales bacterium]
MASTGGDITQDTLGSDVLRALTRGHGLAQALQSCAETIFSHLDAALVRIWVINPDEMILELRASAGIYTHLDGEHSRVPVGNLKIGQIAAQRQAVLTNDVANDDRITNREWAREQKIVSFAGYPLIVGEDVVGVVALFARHRMTDSALESLSSVANSIALSIALDRSESERQHLADQAIASSRLLEAVLDRLPSAVLAAEAPSGRIMWVNRRLKELLGHPDKDIQAVGDYLTSTAHHLDGQPYGVDEYPLLRALRGETVVDEELEYRSATGEQFLLWVSATPVWDDGGRVVAAVSGTYDVTERRRAELERQQFATLVEESGDFIGIANLDGQVQYLNRAGRALVEVETIENTTRSDYFTPQSWAVLRHDAYPAVLAGSTWRGEIQLRNQRSGEAIDGELNLFALHHPHGGHLFAVAAVIRDIRSRKRMDREVTALTDQLGTQLEDMTRLNELSVRLSVDPHLDAILPEVLHSVVTMQRASSGVIMLHDPEADDLYLAASVGLDDAYLKAVGRVARGVGACGQAMALLKPVIIEDVETSDVFAPHLAAARTTAYRAIYSSPLISRRGRLIGTLAAYFPDVHRPSEREVRTTALYAGFAAEVIDNARLYEREHAVANSLQHALLPDDPPMVSGLAIATRYLPVTDGALVGGDWWDVFPMADGQVGLAVGDVVGHNLKAAGIMGRLRAQLRAYAWLDSAPKSVVSHLDDLIRGLREGDLASLIYATWDSETSILTVATAGHPPPLLVTPQGKVKYLDIAGGPLLGASLQAVTYGETRLHLPVGSSIVFYTDGLIEHRHEPITTGLDGLAQVVSQKSSLEPEGLADEILANCVTNEERTDDVALLILKTTGPD